MARPELIALTDDGLAQLANAGLVKRVLRELAQGAAPILNESSDGAVEARFADGVVTRLAEGRGLAEASCSCPSSGVCRHRLGLALAYRQAHAQAGAAAEAWDPGTLDLAAIQVGLTREARAEWTRSRAGGLTVRLTRGATPAAALPTAHVRFLAPRDPAYARCDCAAGSGCAHVALAVEAFRESGGADEVRLGGSESPATSGTLRDLADATLARLLAEGATAGLAAHGARIDAARARAEAEGATWLALALEALAAQIAAYERRSALYDEAQVLQLAAEIHARPRATGAAAMGFGEAMETPMGKTRLVSLGARLHARGDETQASVALFDTDTGAALRVDKTFARSAGEVLMAPGMSLRNLARGQILTSVARRRADGSVGFGAGGGGKTTLIARAPTLEPREPVFASRLDALRERLVEQPPGFLRARDRAADFHVFEVADVAGQMLEPAAQLWRAAVDLAEPGARLHLERRYDAAAPGALDALARAFSGANGRVRQIAGRVALHRGEILCEPWSVSTDALIVPDFDGEGAAAKHAPESLAPVADGPTALRDFLAGALHAGSRSRDGEFLRRGRELGQRVAAAGYVQTVERWERWLAAPADDSDAFGRLAIWVVALLESEVAF